jgi:hypothetical protein
MVRNRNRLAGHGLVALFVVLIGGGVASANNPKTPAADPVTGLPPATGAKMVTLTPQEQLAQAKSFATSFETVRDGIRRELEEARKKNDVVKKLCLDDKLNQIDNAIAKSGDRLKALEAAVKQGDVDLANHEYTILSVLNQRAQQLDAEAKLCVGKEINTVGDSSTKTDIDGTLSGDAEFPKITLVTEPPTCTSCFK